MNFIEEFVEQRTPEWLALRRGVITGSRAVGLTTPARQETLAYTLAWESISFKMEEQVVTDAMACGSDNEASMLERYEFETGFQPRTVGFAWHPAFRGIAGCSPDGIVESDDILIEMKTRDSKQLLYDLTGKLKPEDLHQVQFGMFVTGAKKTQFVVSCLTVDPPYDFNVVTIPHDIELWDKYAQAIEVVSIRKQEILNEILNR